MLVRVKVRVENFINKVKAIYVRTEIKEVDFQNVKNLNF